jgi:hypothetical protein
MRIVRIVFRTLPSGIAGLGLAVWAVFMVLDPPVKSGMGP